MSEARVGRVFQAYSRFTPMPGNVEIDLRNKMVSMQLTTACGAGFMLYRKPIEYNKSDKNLLPSARYEHIIK